MRNYAPLFFGFSIAGKNASLSIKKSGCPSQL